MAESFESWWATLGPITKFTLIFSFLCTAVASSGMVNPMLLLVDFNATVFSLQLWRLLTATFLLGKFSFPWLMAFAMLVTYMKYHEDTNFRGKKADFVWMLAVIIAFLHLCGWLLDMQLLSFSFTMALCWIFCKRNPTWKMSLYFFNFDANIFPWALLLFHVVIGQGLVEDLVGIVAGHGFLFLHDMMPKTHGTNILDTPQFLYNWMPNEKLMPGGVHFAPAARAVPGQAAPARHVWGQGRALGAQ